MQAMELVQKEQMREDVPHFKAGDGVKVHARVVEGEKERLQVFEGVVLKRKGGTMSSSFTVRKVSYGVGVERTFPTHSPMIDRIEVLTVGKVRRSRTYYLRGLTGKAARIKEVRKDIIKPAKG